jgi:hypothetical protein
MPRIPAGWDEHAPLLHESNSAQEIDLAVDTAAKAALISVVDLVVVAAGAPSSPRVGGSNLVRIYGLPAMLAASSCRELRQNSAPRQTLKGG